MILKINDGNGWRFLDGITEVVTHNSSPEDYNKEYNGHGRLFDLVLLDYVVSKDGYATLEFQPGVPMPKAPDVILKEIYAYRHGQHFNLLTDEECYLMSDEGKTIERIN